jgi:hypothetical protein
MHETLLARGLCFRLSTERGTQLVFPSYYRCERPALTQHPPVHMSFHFSGFLDAVYATLVVKLHHTHPFEQNDLWRNAANFKTITGKTLGVKLTTLEEGTGKLEVYFDPTISVEEQMIFCKYIYEHLKDNATEVQRLRHFVCPHCKAPIADLEHARETLDRWLAEHRARLDRSMARPREAEFLPTTLCPRCRSSVQLWDQMEQLFASDETKEAVRALEAQSSEELDTLSKERLLVGEVISTVALAGQIAREMPLDRGIDMEIEFRTPEGKDTGNKIYLQLKSGDSYLRVRKTDGVERFQIKEPRWADIWRQQKFPVWLVVRTSNGKIRWMEVGDLLKLRYGPTKPIPKEIDFHGEPFTALAVQRLRDKTLHLNVNSSD